jgi:hypothetical protein
MLSRTWFVDADAPAAGADGAGWATAYPDLRQALSVAAAGDTIRVGGGTYRPTAGTDRQASFELKAGVGVLGGYAGYGAADPDARDVAGNASVLSGDIGVAGDSSDNSYHVVTGSGSNTTAVLDGFTITGGNASDASPRTTNGSAGGGMLLTNSFSPSIVDCTFADNRAAALGGGLYVAHALPVLTGCTFVRNVADGRAAGTTMAAGGAVACTSTPRFVDCRFYGNAALAGAAEARGGAVYATADVYLTNCLLAGNRAEAGAGFTSAGGGIYFYYTGGHVTNCTVTANEAGAGAGVYSQGAFAWLNNCILWANADAAGDGHQIDYGAPSTLNANACDVQGGWAGTYGNFNNYNMTADPQFVRPPSAGADGGWGTADDDYGDLRVRRTSPVIEAGSNTYAPSGPDLAGNPRILDAPGVSDAVRAEVDMGAYEFVEPARAAVGGALEYGSAGQRAVLRIAFDGDLLPSWVVARNLQVTNLTTGQAVSPASLTVNYDAVARVAVWSLGAALPADGNYRATLPGGKIWDSLGRPLGQDFTFDFFVLSGDANRDRVVNFADLLVLAKNYNKAGATWADGDLTGDGVVNFADLLVLAKAYNQALPAAAAPLLSAEPAVAPVTAAASVLGEEANGAPVFSTTRVGKPAVVVAPTKPVVVKAKVKGR